MVLDQRPPTSTSATVRDAVAADLPVTARLHAELLPLGLFPQLGTRFLRAWQASFLDGRGGIGLVAVGPDGAVLGFLLGSVGQGSRLRELVNDRRRLAALVLAGTLGLLRRPRLAWMFLRTRSRPYARKILALRKAPAPAEPTTEADHQVAVLTAIAVRPEARGGQVGAMLEAEFVRRAAAGGGTVATLVVDLGPGSAAPFYERLGWSPGGERTTRDGHRVRSYRRELGPRAT